MEILRGILQTDERREIADDAKFFDLGLNSSDAIRFISKLERKLRIKVPPEQLLTCSLGELIAYCESAKTIPSGGFWRRIFRKKVL